MSKMRPPKNHLGIRLTAAAATVITVSTLVMGTAQAKNYTYATYLPPNHPTTKALNTFIEEVKETTDGGVTFQLHDSGTLATGKSTITAIKNGLVDGGALMTVYNPTEVPANDFLNELSFYVDDPRVAAAASTETIMNCDQCMDEFLSYNVHYLGSYSTTPYQTMCKANFDDGIDFTSMRIRVPGSEQGIWAKRVGGIPVNMENSEAYQAMQRNQLDCVMGPIAWLKTLSLGEVAKSVVMMPVGGYFAGSLFNFSERDWQKISTEERQALIDATPAGIANAVYNYMEEDEEVAAHADDQGITFYEPTDELLAKREDFLAGQKDRLIKKTAGKVKDGDALFDSLQTNLKKWEKIINEDKNMTREQYVEVLKEHIFSKINP